MIRSMVASDIPVMIALGAEMHRESRYASLDFDTNRLWQLGEQILAAPDSYLAVPGFVNGKRLTEKEAKTYYEARPEILNKYPVYNSGQEANAAAQSRSSIKKYDLNQFKSSKTPK